MTDENHVPTELYSYELPGELIGRAYREAIERRFRFYSFGDAMLIL